MTARRFLAAVGTIALLAGVATAGAAVLWPARESQAPRIPVPPSGEIPVAFVLTDGATMIDFAGPWEVFQDVMLTEGGRMEHPFRLYTVGASREPIRTSGGMTVVPDYTFADAPPPRVVVVPAQRGAPQMNDWLRRARLQASVVMSVCTGAFQLGAAGLLDGKPATTHHDFFDQFESRFPKVRLQRGRRFVQSDEVIFTAGGLTSGIDLALHIVDRYFGHEVAERTAFYMEYQGTGWKR
jgi:transcriptional regulator GlxA family with amidase domain